MGREEGVGVGVMGMGNLTLVDISLGVVGSLILLVDEGILSGRETGADACVRVFGNALVGLLGSLGTGALDGLRDVVCCLL